MIPNDGTGESVQTGSHCHCARAYKKYDRNHVDLLARTNRLEQALGTGDDLIELRNEIISGDDSEALEQVETLERQDREVVVNHLTKWPGLS